MFSRIYRRMAAINEDENTVPIDSESSSSESSTKPPEKTVRTSGLKSPTK